jgi:Protein of unknown function (DUF992)
MTARAMEPRVRERTQGGTQARLGRFHLANEVEVSMRHISWIGSAAAVAVAAALTSSGATAAPDRVKAGTLDCDVSAGIGLIIGSQKGMTCMFTPANGGPREVYRGTISKFGLDVGATTGGKMAWAVYAPTSQRFAALAGNYGGATGEATIGAGLGANVLVGGSQQTVALQPLSVQGQTGLNLAAGVASLELRPAR